MAESHCAHVWLPELVERFARYLPENVVACDLRLVDKATAAQFRGRPECTTVRLSQLVSPRAFAQRWTAPDAMRSLSLLQRHKLLCLTAASGSVINLQVALRHVGFLPTDDQKLRLVVAAAAAGALDVCRWLLQRGYPASTFAMEAAAQAGRRAVCELLLTHGVSWQFRYVRAAARGGHPDLMEWLMALRVRHASPAPRDHPADSAGSGGGGGVSGGNGGSGSGISGVAAAAGDGSGPGNLDSGGNRPLCLSATTCGMLLEAAAEGCELSELQDLFRRFLGGGVGADSRNGDVGQPQQQEQQELQDVEQPHLQERQQRQHDLALLARSRTSNSRMLQHCRLGAARSATADWRAKLEWLMALVSPAAQEHEPDGLGGGGNGGGGGGGDYDWKPLVCAAAAAASRHDASAASSPLERLQWLRRLGYPVDGREADAATERGDAAALEYLIGRCGVTPSGAAVARAAEAGALEVLQLLHASGGEQSSLLDAAQVALAAAKGGQLRVLVWAAEVLGAVVAEQPQPTPQQQQGAAVLMEAAATAGCVAVMAWLHERGCPWGVRVFTAAAAAGSVEALEWLASHGCPMGDSGAPYLAAASNWDVHTLRGLARLGCPWGREGDVFMACLQPPRCAPLPVLRCLAELGCPVWWASAAYFVRRRGRGGITHAPAETRAWLAAELHRGALERAQQ